jgi:hypothetical protein
MLKLVSERKLGDRNAGYWIERFEFQHVRVSVFQRLID